MTHGDDGDGPRRRGPASRLPAHRAVLALGLLAAGPPLVLHDGWRGAVPAVAAAGYAVYLVAGKRLPWRSRRSARVRGARRAPGSGGHPPGYAPAGEEHPAPDAGA
jgi:hypothetical protein